MVLRKQRGQVLVIVILVMMVALAIGLPLASRSITSLKSSTEEAESQKALAAAEAGIERAIQGSVPVDIPRVDFDNNSYYETRYDAVDGAVFLLNGGNIIPKDEGADLWLSNYSSTPSANFSVPWSGNLTIYWGDSATACDNSALEIVIILAPKDNPVSKKYAYDPCLLRRNGNHFTAPEPLSDDGSGVTFAKTFYHKAVIPDYISSGLIARIIPIYGNASIGIDGGTSPLPLQGYKIDSTGTSGEASRKITVFKGYPQAYLPYLSYGLFVAN